MDFSGFLVFEDCVTHIGNNKGKKLLLGDVSGGSSDIFGAVTCAHVPSIACVNMG